jgi:hypothetical protein
MDSLLLQNVRCFRSAVSAPLAPLTLLVGENSTGKSTFLAMTRLAWDIARGAQVLDFNEAPFQLGAFDQIANSGREGLFSHESAFDVGLGFTLHSTSTQNVDDPCSIISRFAPHGSQPRLVDWTLKRDSFSVNVKYLPRRKGEDTPIEAWFTAPSGKYSFQIPFFFAENMPIDLGFIHYALMSAFGERQRQLPLDDSIQEIKELPHEYELGIIQTTVERIREKLPPRPFATAPIRSEPKRTYDPIRELQRAAGAHIPMKLAEMAGSRGTEWKYLQERLIQFGYASGLFRRIDVKRLGDTLSAPFQLDIQVSNDPVNIADVGYGVSQVLPILVECLTSDQDFFLLQQPEVHLHPRAQAELGTLLGGLVANESKRFIVETHSDYILDRIRLDVRDGLTISADQVIILFFERTQNDVIIHPLGIDESGNIIDAPPAYREFFLKEEARFFGD